MDSSVLLSADELRIRDASRQPLELAVLAGSMLTLLGNHETVAPDLARILAGIIPPVSGGVLLRDHSVNLDSHSSGGLVGYVPYEPDFPEDVTVMKYLQLAAASAGYGRRETGEILRQTMGWCSLDEIAGSSAGNQNRDVRYRIAFAASCLSVPLVTVLQGPVPEEMYPLLEDLCHGGSAVVVSVPELQYLPPGTDRIALCDQQDVRKIVRFQEFSDACSSMMRLRVKFLPALPRAVLESLPGARDIVAVPGGYEFNYGSLSSTINNLVNLARANSRQIAGLEVRPPQHSELLESFIDEDRTGEADLFCAEDLDI
jgi:ABC-type transport system involved in cytochrome c biogenesis ATPase subunit